MVLGDCLAGLASTSASEGAPQVIVVDDGSTDGTASLAERWGARLVRTAGLGPAAARNAGVRASTGEIVVFLDADCVPEAGCLDALLAPFADAEVSGVRGGYATRQRSLVARFVQLEMEEKQARMAASDQAAVVDTACAAYRRRVFLEHGGFDESFSVPSVEDADFSFRLTARGERLLYAPGARVSHSHPETLRAYCGRKLRFGYYRARLYRRYPSRVREDGYTPRLMPLQILLAGGMLPAGLASPWSAAARAVLAVLALAFFFCCLPLTRRAWRGDRPLVPLVPPMLLARSLAQGVGLAAGLVAQLFAGGGRKGEAPSSPREGGRAAPPW